MFNLLAFYSALELSTMNLYKDNLYIPKKLTIEFKLVKYLCEFFQLYQLLYTINSWWIPTKKFTCNKSVE